MSYWGSLPEESDFGFSAVGVAMLRIKKKMQEDIQIVNDKAYPEQSIISSLVCLRLLGKRFPKNLSVHFRRNDLNKAKASFHQWFQKVENYIPDKYRAKLLEEAEEEFGLFEKEFFKS